MTFTFIDVVFLIIILFCAINATIKGFLHELFSKTAFFLGILLATFFTAKLSPYLLPIIKIEILTIIISFVLIFIGVYLIVKVIQQCISSLFQGEIMSGLDKALGLIFGIFEGLIITSFILLILYIQPWFDTLSFLDSSFFHHLLQNILSGPTNYLQGKIANV